MNLHHGQSFLLIFGFRFFIQSRCTYVEMFVNERNLLPPRSSHLSDLIMKICGLITVISIKFISAFTARILNPISSENRTASALELLTSIHCNASAFWLPEKKSADEMYSDCFHLTLAFLRIADATGRDTFEFHAAGVRPSQWPLRTKTTPLKYSYSTHLTDSNFSLVLYYPHAFY